MIAEIITCNNTGVVTLLRLWLEKHILIKLLLLKLIFTIVSILFYLLIILERSIIDILFLRALAVIFVLVLLLALLLRRLTLLFFELILP